MQFRKLVTKKNALLKETDLKLIRAIEDIISIGGIFDELPTVVQNLIKEREALRKSGGDNNG
jgi:hypothetical protein